MLLTCNLFHLLDVEPKFRVPFVLGIKLLETDVIDPCVILAVVNVEVPVALISYTI